MHLLGEYHVAYHAFHARCFTERCCRPAVRKALFSQMLQMAQITSAPRACSAVTALTRTFFQSHCNTPERRELGCDDRKDGTLYLLYALMPLTDQSAVLWNQLSLRAIPYLKASNADKFAYNLQAQDWTTQGLCKNQYANLFEKEKRHSHCSRRFVS